MNRTFMIRLRIHAKGKPTPIGDHVGDHDVFILQDIGRRKPASIVKEYAASGFHVIVMIPIPDWEGPTS